MRKFWKRDNDDEEIVRPKIVTVDAAGLYRQMLHDTSVPDPEIVAKVLGISPVSEEVAEMEEAESNRRTEALAPLLPILDLLAAQAANIAVVMHCDVKDADDLLQDSHQIVGRAYYGVALSAILGALSTLNDKGMISVNVDAVFKGRRVE